MGERLTHGDGDAKHPPENQRPPAHALGLDQEKTHKCSRETGAGHDDAAEEGIRETGDCEEVCFSRE